MVNSRIDIAIIAENFGRALCAINLQQSIRVGYSACRGVEVACSEKTCSGTCPGNGLKKRIVWYATRNAGIRSIAFEASRVYIRFGTICFRLIIPGRKKNIA